MALPMPLGGLDAIEHVIVLMQENRSFDHYFGTLQGVRGYGDRVPLRLPGGGTVFEQPTPFGKVLPFSLRQGAEDEHRPESDIQYLGSLDHTWTGTGLAWARGWYNDWIIAKTAATMTYYERQDIPLQYELADNFTLCDAYPCSVFGSTNPNRLYLWTGTIGYEPGTKDRAVTNAASDHGHPGYDWTTYAERLEQAGVSWKVYQEWDNFGDNSLEYFKSFKAIGTKVLSAVDGKYRTLAELYEGLPGKPADEQRRLLSQIQQGRESLSPAERSLYDRALDRVEPERLVDKLRADIAAHRLPKVTWIVPSEVDSEHPSGSTPVGSANLIYQVLDAIASETETWGRTALLLNFDENDGYFDHVAPPVPPVPDSGNSDDWFDGQPIGLGPRVPMTIVSPWTIGGHVNSQVFDHTSVVRFLERFTGVGEPNISEWRRTTCGDLTSAFDFANGGTPPAVHQPGPVPKPIDRWHPSPPSDQRLPLQEPGRRPARALPHQPEVSGVLTPQGELALRLSNRGSESAHFAVYPYAEEFKEPLHVGVLGEHAENIKIGDKYDLAVQGPNRFWFELAGSRTGRAAGIGVRTLPESRTGELRLELRNNGGEDVVLHLRPLGYIPGQGNDVRVPAGTSQTVPWPTDHGWYDVEVTTPQDTDFRRRITGHVETPTPSVTG